MVVNRNYFQRIDNNMSTMEITGVLYNGFKAISIHSLGCRRAPGVGVYFWQSWESFGQPSIKFPASGTA